MSRRNRRPLAWLAALALLAVAGPAAAAGDAALGKLLEVLYSDGTISAEAYTALRAALEAEAAEHEREVEEAASRAQASVRDEVQREVDEAVGTGRVVHKRDRLYMTDASKGAEMTLSGRIHSDSVWYDEEGVELSSGAEIRRLRLDLRGTVWHDWDFSAGLELAGGDVSLRSVNVTYRGFERFEVSVGRLRHPIGMDDLTSSNDTTFMERDPTSDNLVPERQIGVALSSSGDHWGSRAGVFWANAPEGGDRNGLLDMDGGWSVGARQTFAPWAAPRRVLHFGVASAYQSGGEIGEARFSARPGSHVTDVRFVDTGSIEAVERALFYSGELAASLGPFFFQGEYIGTRLRREDLATLDFHGFYAQASWFLTGESRPYSASRGVFGGVAPRRPFSPSEGGAGAWEVAVRYGTLDLNSEEIEGGQQDLVTVGLNWYANSNVRFMFNWAKLLDVDRRGTVFDDDRAQSIGLRSQVTW